MLERVGRVVEVVDRGMVTAEGEEVRRRWCWRLLFGLLGLCMRRIGPRRGESFEGRGFKTVWSLTSPLGFHRREPLHHPIVTAQMPGFFADLLDPVCYCIPIPGFCSLTKHPTTLINSRRTVLKYIGVEVLGRDPYG